VREARRLRGRADRGLRALRGIAVPVLEGALDHSLELAAAMDSRGYGRRAAVHPAVRRAASTLTLTGLLGVCAGLYGLLDAGSPGLLGLPLLGLGLALGAAGMVSAGRMVQRTRYRPDPWSGAEWVTVAAGFAAAAAAIVGAALDPQALIAPVVPLAWPTLPILPALGLVVALVPAFVTPPPPAVQPVATATPRSPARAA
jgi:energy-coupling factor transport system permease protein